MTGDRWQIALAKPDQAVTVVRLVTELLKEVAVLPLALPEDEATSLCIKMMEEGHYLPIIAHRGGHIAGVLCLGRGHALYAAGEFGIIEELYVEPAFRGEGLGSELICFAEAVATKKRWQRLEVGAPRPPRQDAAVRFYERSGFICLGPRLFKSVA